MGSKLRSAVGALLLLLIPEVALAGQSTGLIAAIAVTEYSAPNRVALQVLLSPGSTIESPPACSPDGLKFSFDLNTTTGRAVLPVLQMALVTGVSVRLTGDGTCTFVGGIEDGSGLLYVVP